MVPNPLVIHVVRKDLRIQDNPILHHLATAPDHGVEKFLPVYIFPAHQVVLSGFIKDGSDNPYPAARSAVGGFFRCGPHRATFTAEAVWDTKKQLTAIGSGLLIRVGMIADIIQDLVEGLKEKGQEVGAVWMTSHEGTEEEQDEQAVASLCEKGGLQFKLWVDEKYYIDE